MREKLSNLVSNTKKFILSNKLISLIVTFALVLRVIGLVPNLGQHPDESGIADAALKMAINLTLKPTTYRYGTFYIYLQAVVAFIIRSSLYIHSAVKQIIYGTSLNLQHMYSFSSLAAGGSTYNSIYIWWGRLLTAVFGSLTVLVVYKLGKELFGKKVALSAALILAVSPLHVRDSQYITIEVAWTFITTLAVYFLALYLLKNNRRSICLGGFLVGLSSSMKYLPIALPAFLASFLLSFNIKNTRDWLLDGSMGFLAIIAGFIFGSPYLLFNLDSFFSEMDWFFNFYGKGVWWTAGAGLKLNFLTGKFMVGQLGFIYQYGLGEIVTFFLFIGIVAGMVYSARKSLLLISSPLFTIAFFTLATKTGYTRHMVPPLPFLAVFAAFGIVKVFNLLLKIRFLSFHKTIVLASILFIAILPEIARSLPASFYCGREQSIVKARRWLENNPQRIPEGSRVARSYGIDLPAGGDYEKLELLSEEDYLYSNLAKNKIEYVLLYDAAVYGFLDWKRKYIIPPKKLIDKSIIMQSVRLLFDKGKIIASFTKPIDYEMCGDYNVYVVKIN